MRGKLGKQESNGAKPPRHVIIKRPSPDISGHLQHLTGAEEHTVRSV